MELVRNDPGCSNRLKEFQRGSTNDKNLLNVAEHFSLGEHLTILGLHDNADIF